MFQTIYERPRANMSINPLAVGHEQHRSACTEVWERWQVTANRGNCQHCRHKRATAIGSRQRTHSRLVVLHRSDV